MTEEVGLPVWTVYEHPLDYPQWYVVRRSWVIDGKIVMEPKPCGMGATLEDVRATIPEWLTRMPRQPGDDPVIVETWF